MAQKLICKPECRFCKIRDGIYVLGNVDKPVMESERYIALASLGGFIEGWSLVVSKEHIYSMKKMYADPELVKFLNKLIRKIEKVYRKRCIIFEHGANHEGSVIACGTNHAHLHIIPYEKTLLDLMHRDNKEWIECSIENIAKIVDGKEYWFYAEDVEDIQYKRGYVHIIKKPESQYFRKLLAEKENCMEQYDYKEHWFEKLVETTYCLLKG